MTVSNVWSSVSNDTLGDLCQSFITMHSFWETCICIHISHDFPTLGRRRQLKSFLVEEMAYFHDDVIKWEHFTRHRAFVRGIHRWPVDSLQKGQWRGALMFSLICAWTNGRANHRDAGNLRPHRAHYDVTVIYAVCSISLLLLFCRRKERGNWQPWYWPSYLLIFCLQYQKG